MDDLIRNYENAVEQSTTSCDEYLTGRDKLIRENREDLKPEALERKLSEYDAEHKLKLTEKVNAVKEKGAQLNDELKKGLKTSCRAYTPETDADRITFLIEEQNFKDELDVTKPEQIVEGYQKAVSDGDGKLIQMYEDCAFVNLKRRNSPLAGRMDLYKQRNIKSRMPESYKKATEVSDKYKSLFRSIDGVLEVIEKKKPSDWGLNLHVFIGLSGSKIGERWNARTINMVSKGIPLDDRYVRITS